MQREVDDKQESEQNDHDDDRKPDNIDLVKQRKTQAGKLETKIPEDARDGQWRNNEYTKKTI